MVDVTRTPVRPRWWPVAAIAVAAIGAFAWVWWFGPERERQERVFMTVPVLLGTVVLLVLWLLCFSRLRWGMRLRTIAAFLLVLAAGAATLRVRGVTGDFVPVFEWRWSGSAAPALELPAAPPKPRPEIPREPEKVAAPEARPADASPPASVVTDPKPPVVPAPVGEYPQFLGPHRNGTVVGIQLATDWQAKPPRLLWRRQVGIGWSGFAVADGIAVTQEQRGEREMVIAYDLATGAPKWSHGDVAQYVSTIAGTGPRATPTISRGRVFALGSTGILNCLDLQTGKQIWQRDVAADNGAEQPEWGRSGSPLVVDDFVVVPAGGPDGRSLVAYHRESGARVWQAGNDRLSYSSPHLASLAGVRQIVILNHASIVGHDPVTGRILWEHPWQGSPAAAQPLVLPGDRVLFSGAYGMGSKLLQIAAGENGELRASQVWASMRLKAKFANPVLHQGFVYALDDGVLVCLDPADGERRWKSGRYGHGQVILVGDVLLVQTEEGEIVLVDPRPDQHRELTRLTVFSQKTWNPPALAGRFLVVRNDVEAACYELPMKP
jgi:outer membrane protein assembly factor BamB